MSQSALDPRVAALLSAGANDFSSADPNNGEGVQGEWPPAGDHDLLILGCSEKAGKFKEKGGRAVDCVEVTFEYEWIRDTKDPTYDPSKPPLVFKGERFQLVPAFESAIVDDGSKTRARIGWERFTGHITKILGITKEQCTNPLQRYSEVKTKIAQSKIAVVAKIDERDGAVNAKTGRTPTYRSEYIVSLLS